MATQDSTFKTKGTTGATSESVGLRRFRIHSSVNDGAIQLFFMTRLFVHKMNIFRTCKWLLESSRLTCHVTSRFFAVRLLEYLIEFSLSFTASFITKSSSSTFIQGWLICLSYKHVLTIKIQYSKMILAKYEQVFEWCCSVVVLSSTRSRSII